MGISSASHDGQRRAFLRKQRIRAERLANDQATADINGCTVVQLRERRALDGWRERTRIVNEHEHHMKELERREAARNDRWW